MSASVGGPGRAIDRAASTLGRFSPWALTLIRLVTAQALLLANVEMMVGQERLGTSLDPGWWARTVVGVASSDPGHVVGSVCPLLLATGLLARPAAVLLLLEAMLLHPTAALRHFVSLWDLLLLSVVLLGPGRLALDGLFRSGLTRSAVPGAAAIVRLHRDLERFGEPLLLFLLRLAVAGVLLSIVGPGGPPSVAIAASLALGFAVRILAPLLFVLLAVGHHYPPAIASPDPALPAMLLLSLLLTRGGGLFALDRLIDGWLGRFDRPRGWLPRIVVVGAGFGGVAAARALRESPCEVLLIDRQNHHLFQSLLYQVATGTLSPADIAMPIRRLCRSQDNLSVLLGEVTGVNRSARTVTVDDRSLAYDFLVIATGAEHSYLGHDTWHTAAPGLKTLADATSIRGRILSAFEAAEATDDEAVRQSLLTFVIVGGGPTGVELAGAIADLAHLGLVAE